MTQPIIEFRNATITYEDRIAVRGITAKIYPGEFIGIIGPNGSGKTTLFRGILGMQSLARGDILVHGRSVRNESKSIRKSVGYLPQRESLDPTVPGLVREVVLMGLYSQIGLFRRPGEKEHEQVRKVLRMVEMEEHIDDPVGHLSGGQQQRVFLARALVSNPDMLLLDEPTSAIDPGTQARLIELISQVQSKLNLTILFITHDVNHLIGRVHRVMYLNQELLGFGPTRDVLKEEILSRVYGQVVRVITLEDGEPCVIVSDSHV